MTDSRPRTALKPDPLVITAVGLFAVAVLCAAYPAFRSAPQMFGGLMLLLGLGGVALLSVLALRGGRASVDDGLGVEGLIEALSEPAALATPDGRIVAANGPWIEAAGPARRLPKAADGGLFTA